MNRSGIEPKSGAWTKAVNGWIVGVCAAWALAACGGGGGGGSAPPVTPPVIVAPTIGTQPVDAKVIDGSTATFNVSATGSTLSYQWQRDGQSIAGATGASYTTPVLRMADNNARYQVVVSGPNTSVTSSVAALTVTPIALNLTTQPAAQSAKDGDALSFDVRVTGSEPIQYQWQRNGVAIAGADKATYTTSALLGDDAAVYMVVVTNPAGSVTSQSAKLTVAAVPPRVVTAPESVTTTDGTTITFNVTAAGSAPLAYQWLRNGSAISGATGSSYTTTLAYAGSGDRYTVQVTNTTGQVVSAAAIATVNANAPGIAAHPADLSIATGGSASFTVSASGTAPLRYQWQQSQDEGLNWAPIAGATSATYAVSNATLADTQTRLRVAVSNPVSTVNSNAASLTVRPNVRILAGTAGGKGYADGKGSAVRFSAHSGISADAAGNIYVVDSWRSVIRRVSPDGTVKLFAGQPHVVDRVDGSLAQARFSYAYDVLADPAGPIYVAENCAIRRIADGKVDTFAGNGSCLTRDGAQGQASVGQVLGMALGADGNLFITERTRDNGQVVRKITAAGAISTVAGSLTESGDSDGSGTAARFFSIGRLAADASGNLYVADGSAIRQITSAGNVTTYAGSPGNQGPIEGFRTAARFGPVTGLAFDARGNLFFADVQRIYRISASTGNVAMAVGTVYGVEGYTQSIDGPGPSGSAGYPGAMVRLPDGNLAFVDNLAYTVRVMTPSAVVSTLAGGDRSGGFADGIGAAARFASQTNQPNGFTLAPSGTLTLTDNDNRRIRRFTLGINRLDTLAGSGSYGGENGPALAATFVHPMGAAYDAAGNLYVADGSVIRRINSAGVVSTVAGKFDDYRTVDGVGAAARFSFATGLVVDSKGNVIVADAYGYVLRRMAPDGTVTTLAGKVGEFGIANGVGSEARLANPRYLAIDSADNVYFTDGYHAIRKVAPNGQVSPVAGAPYANALIDDIGAFARFNNPSGLAFDARGNLYVADTGNNAIRRITPDGQVSTVIGDATGVQAVLQPGLGGRINAPTSIVVTPAGRLVFLSEGAIVGD